MTAKTATERSRERRERMRDVGFTNCSVYAHPQDHPALRKLARELGAKRLDALRVKQKGDKL